MPLPSTEGKVSLKRSVSRADMRKMNMKLMPGFKLTWYYSNNSFNPDANYRSYNLNKSFYRKVFKNVPTTT